MIKIKASLRLKVSFLIIAALTVPATTQAQEDLFNLKKLANFGKKKYKMTWIDRRSEKPVEVERGTMVLEATQNKDSVSIKNLTRMYLPDGKRFIEYHADCNFLIRDKKMTARSMKYKVVRSDKVVLLEIEASIVKGKIIQNVVEDDVESTEETIWVDGTYPDLAVFFLIPQLPKKAGQKMEIEHVMTFPIATDTKATARKITCMGIDKELKIDGQQVTKFINKADNEETEIQYWVDSQEQLRRVQLNSENRLDLISDLN